MNIILHTFHKTLKKGTEKKNVSSHIPGTTDYTLSHIANKDYPVYA